MQIHLLNRFNTYPQSVSVKKTSPINQPLIQDTVSFGAQHTHTPRKHENSFLQKIKYILNVNRDKTNQTEQAKCKVLDLNTTQTKDTQKTTLISQADADFLNILNKLGNFTLEEFNSLSKQELNFLRNKYRKMAKSKQGFISGGKDYSENTYKISFRELEYIHNKAVDYIKTTLDAKYGEGRYAVIITGRSLSSIGKCLGYRIGENNVINIPMSEADKYLKPHILKSEHRSGAIDELNKYLEKSGLTKETINNPDKKYVLVDYCYTGDSLKGAEKLLKSKYVFGNCNIDAVDVKYCIPDSHFREHFIDILCDSKLKELAMVNKCFDLYYISERTISPQCFPSNYKLILFKLLDNQVKKINGAKTQNV